MRYYSYIKLFLNFNAITVGHMVFSGADNSVPAKKKNPRATLFSGVTLIPRNSTWKSLLLRQQPQITQTGK